MKLLLLLVSLSLFCWTERVSARRLEDFSTTAPPADRSPPFPEDDPFPPHFYRTESPYSSPTVRGDLCQDAVPIATPFVGQPTLLGGTMNKLYSFPQCYHWYEGSATAAAVYTVTGNGGILEVAPYQGPNYDQAYVTVFRGCNSDSEQFPSPTSWGTEAPYWAPTSNYNNGNNNNNQQNGNNNDNNNNNNNNIYSGSNRGNRRLEEDEWMQEEEHEEWQQEQEQQEEEWMQEEDHDHDENDQEWQQEQEEERQQQQQEEEWQQEQDRDENGQDWQQEEEREDEDRPWWPGNTGSCVEGHSYQGTRWQSEEGQDYTIVVHVQNMYQARDYVVQVSTVETTDICQENEAEPTDLGSLDYNKTITAFGSTRDGVFLNLDSCDFTLNSRARTYLVTVPESGVRVSASVQGDARVAAFQGGCDAGGWTCRGIGSDGTLPPGIPFPDDDYRNEEDYQKPFFRQNDRLISWHNAQAGATYLLVVSTCCSSQATGDFLLSIDMEDYGNVCRDATAVASLEDFSTTIDFGDMPLYNDVYACNSRPYGIIQTPIAFYEIQGTGESVLASVARSRFSYGTRMGLFEAPSCDSSPVCVISDDWRSAFVFPTESGQTHYLGVYSEYDYEYGENIELSFQTVNYGSVCEDAVDLGAIGDESVQVTNSLAGAKLYQNLYSCNFGMIESPARIYSFTAAQTGSVTITAQTSGEVDEFNEYGQYIDLQLGVYEGSCFRPSCVYSEFDYLEDNSRAVYLEVQEGVTYFLSISDGSGGQLTDFELTVETAQLASPCEGATAIESVQNGLEISGSTAGGGQYNLPQYCSRNTRRSIGTLYTLTLPTTTRLSVSVSSFEFNPQVSVFQTIAQNSEDCDPNGFFCVSDNSRGPQTSWEAEAMSTYLIVVFGCCSSSEVGEFTLRFDVSEMGDVCEDVTELGVLPEEGFLLSNSTSGAPSYSFQSPCYDPYEASPATRLYSLVARTSGKMTARLRFADRSNLQLSVYSGSCEFPSCVGTGSQYYPLSWDALEGQLYFVAVHDDYYSPSFEGGEFVLTVDDAEEGNLCEEVVDLGTVSSEGKKTLGSTSGGGVFSSLPYCYDQILSPAAVFSVTAAESGTLTAKVISNEIDVRLSVYRGTCDGRLVCNGDHEWRGVNWDATAGETVYIVVHSCCDVGSVGSFLLEIESLSNGDVCTDSIDLGNVTENPIVAVGSTEDSKLYPSLPSCSYQRPLSRTNVYSVKASSGGQLHASVFGSNFDGQLTVFKGACDGLWCLSTGYQYSSSDLSWDGEEGSVYHIAVHSYSQNEAGDYILRVESRRSGDMCQDAIDLGTVSEDLLIEAGSTSDGGLYSSVETCYDKITSPAKVYKITSPGGVMTARVDGDGFDARVSVYRGNCEDNALTCASYDYGDATWEATEGEVFLVVVHGCCGRSSAGGFVLQVNVIEYSDACRDALTLGTPSEGGILYEASGDDAGIFRDIEQCNYGQNFLVATLFSVTGTGDTFIATVIGDGYFGHQVSVYTGNCASLRCADTDSNNGKAVWKTIQGQEYYVLVVGSGVGNGSSDFILSLATTSPGDICNAERLNIQENKMFVSGSTEGSGVFGLPTCYDSIASPTKLYSMMVSSPRIISITADRSSRDTQVSVYQGGCNETLECVDFHTWRYVQWAAEPDTPYTIAVSGSRAGEFLLQVDSLDSGSFCDDAVPLGSISNDGLELSGSTAAGLVFSGSPSCIGREPGQSPEVVYSLKGNGGLITAIVTGSTGYEGPQLSLLGGTCDALECPDFSLDYDGRTWILKWNSVANASYFLVVSTCCGLESSVDFQLRIDSAPVSDLCTDSLIATIPSPESAPLNLTGTFEDEAKYFPALCDGSFSRPAVVYTVVGTGDVLSVSSAPGFRLSVSAGNCSATACIGYSSQEEGTITLVTVPGMPYFFTLYAEGNRDENFQLTLETMATSDVCTSDQVVNLGLIPVDGLRLTGSTRTSAIFTGLPSCFDEGSGLDKIMGPGVVYSMPGDGKSYLISVEGQRDRYGMNVDVYNGRCSSLACAVSSGDGRSALLETAANETYTLLVSDCCNAGASSAFSLQISPVTVGDIDLDATELVIPESGSVEQAGSTDGAPFFTGLPDCYSSVSGPSAVFKVQGVPGVMMASATGFGIDAQVSVYQSDGTGGFECVGDHGWHTASWSGIEGMMYYVVVTDCCDVSTTGNFLLRIEMSTTGSICEEMVDLGDVGADGLIHADATTHGFSQVISIDGYCNNTHVYQDKFPPEEELPANGESRLPAKLFRLDGKNSSLTATVFMPLGSRGSDFNIMLLKGTCGSFECVENVETYSSRSLSWTGEFGSTYFILVSSCCDALSAGEFVLKVQETSGMNDQGGQTMPVPIVEDVSSGGSDSARDSNNVADEGGGVPNESSNGSAGTSSTANPTPVASEVSESLNREITSNAGYRSANRLCLFVYLAAAALIFR